MLLTRGLPVLQPTNLKSPEFLEELKSYKANLQIVVAFRMLPVAVWDMPEIGTFQPAWIASTSISWCCTHQLGDH